MNVNLINLVYILNRYACLVAESPSDANSEPKTKLVGVVDVTALGDEAVLQHLQGADEYLYVSGLAVSKRFRYVPYIYVLFLSHSTAWAVIIMVINEQEEEDR